MFVISEDRTRICPSQQLLSALHLPFQALDSMTSTISKVSWLSGLHPDEDNVYTRKGMAVGMQHIHGLVAREFVSNFINYFESCKRKLPSSESEAQVSEYVVTPEKRMNYHSTVDIASPIRTRTRAARKARSVPQQSQSAILPVPPRRKEIRTTTPPPRRPFLQAKQTASQGPVQARTVQDINPPPQGGTSNVQPVDGVHRHARRSESIAHGGGSHVRFAVQDQRATEAPPRHTTRYKRSHTTDSSDDGTLLKVAKDSRANDVWSAASRPRLPHGTARNVDLAEPSTHCDSVSSLAGTAHDVPPTGAVASTASQAHSYQGPSDSYMKRTTQTVVQREVAHTVTTTPHRGTPSSSTNSGHDVLSISGDVASTASAASKRKLDDAASSTRTGPEPDLPIQASAPATTEGDELRTPAGEADEVSLSAPKRAGQSAQSSSTATEPRERVEPGANGVIWVIIDPGLLDPLRTDDLKVTDNVEVVSEDDSEPGPVRRKSLATGTGTAKVSPGKGKGRPRVKRQFRLQAVVYIPPHHFHNGGAGPVRRRGANHGGTDALQTEVPTSDGQSQQGNESNEDGDGEDESGNWEDEDEESE
ncbi:hypothetical protein C8Q80DRAFT_1199056 [Daedaleopsis nitida]|nr:hypothetical protein C8Q80DRAFT_1199056 [Daedaleopsis nitida]